MSVEQSRAEHAARQRWERALPDPPSRARRASGPARPSGVALTWPPDDPSGLLEAVTAPRISGDTITAGVAVMTGGGLLMRLLWISERRAGLR